ncbi:MAG: amidohydrolase family protein [Candidatus Thorarchaeota archaeon]
MSQEWRYSEDIFDAHTHAVDLDALGLMVRVGSALGIRHSLLVLHEGSVRAVRDRYPAMFVFARPLYPGELLDICNSPTRVDDVTRDGYSVLKVHFAPFWIDRLEDTGAVRPVDDPSLDCFFEAAESANIPVLIHVSDPDTYYRSRYANAARYGTKDKHISQFESRLSRHPGLTFQVAHFCAQPEIERLDNLDRLMRSYNNLYVDTGSARWMARELGVDPARAHNFFVRHSRRILFGSDCVARSDDPEYYRARYYSERMLLESDVRGLPLPFVDNDTVNAGGTVINGLALPDHVLRQVYWENAQRLYGDALGT